jgi:phosphoglycerate-specific signal transduction histidine kinase
MPFYKLDENATLQTANQVFAPEITLVEEDKNLYTYPQYGWYWFENLEQAVEALKLKVISIENSNTEATEPDNKYITKLAFRNRFTNAEKLALYTAAESNVQLKVFLDDLAAATFVDLTRPDTIAGINFLETVSLLAEGRAVKILDSTNIAEIEKWTG